MTIIGGTLLWDDWLFCPIIGKDPRQADNRNRPAAARNRSEDVFEKVATTNMYL